MSTPATGAAAARWSASGAAGATGATPPGMAVVILMLPAAGDPAHPGSGATSTSGAAPLTYRLSLAPGAESATIELEGRPPVTAPVQRVYPSPAPPPVSPSSLALLRSVPSAPPGRAPAAGPAWGAPPRSPDLPRPRRLAAPSALQPAEPLADSADPRMPAISGRPIPTATRPRLPADQIEFTSANGAPIIE